MKSVLAGLLCLIAGATAQSKLYEQCGGVNWAGPTTCVTGAICQYYNDWYSQCVPGTGNPGTTTAATSTKSSSTSTSWSSTSARSSSTSQPPTSTGFPKTSGTKFNIDGTVKYFAGTNCYWCSMLASKSDVDLVMSHIAQSGLKILRVWGFNDVNQKPGGDTTWFQYLSASGSEINTGATGLQRLDAVVASAEKYGVKLIINFVNNWNDYGGINAYVNAFGGSKTTWYTNTAAQNQYRAYIRAVVGRYVNSKAILAWELANEPRCQGCSTDVIFNWATSVSQFVKSLDPNHLVTLGDEGFGLPGDGSYPYQYSEGVDWQKNLGIRTLDFATFHLYPESWGTTADWGNGWVKSHAALCAAAGKPCFFEEYGYTSDHCGVEGAWQATSLAANGMAGDAFWQFGDTISTGKSHDDGHTIYYGDSDWTCLVTNHVKNIG